MAGHTPGPWAVDESFINGSINAGDKHIAMANFYNSHDDFFRVDRQQQLANARLIASAPDLLEALKQCQEAMRLNLVKAAEKNELVLLDAYNAAANAIAKAEGRE